MCSILSLAHDLGANDFGLVKKCKGCLVFTMNFMCTVHSSFCAEGSKAQTIALHCKSMYNTVYENNWTFKNREQETRKNTQHYFCSRRPSSVSLNLIPYFSSKTRIKHFNGKKHRNVFPFPSFLSFLIFYILILFFRQIVW